jgi:hypothetical protein
MHESAIQQVVKTYMMAWNETDVANRKKLLVRCWGVEAVYIDPSIRLSGRDALAQHIAKVQSGRPGARLEFQSGIDAHHNVVRFLWRLVRYDGTVDDTSIDFGEIGADGRLEKVVGFFDAAPNIDPL